MVMVFISKSFDVRLKKKIFFFKVLPKLFGLSGFLGVNPLLDMESSVVIPINLPFIKTLAPLVFDLLQKVTAVNNQSIVVVFLIVVLQVRKTCDIHYVTCVK